MSESVWRCERVGEGKCACWCMSESVWRCERVGEGQVRVLVYERICVEV